jgi:sigma-54 dependent transcriptional regulator, acetoin dehydrogenase operon transcriptional activator AcoR
MNATPTQPADRRSHVQRILDVVRPGAATLPPGLGASPHATATGASLVVADSWARCLDQYGLDPAAPRRPPVLERAELDDRRERLSDLVACASPEMAALYRQLDDPVCAVVLTDTDGVILHLVAAAEFARQMSPVGLRVGAVWSEAEAGTNGMGTCLAAARPIAVHQHEHFFTRYTALSCAAVPILDPQGALAGVLDVTSRGPTPHSLPLLDMTARMVENRWLDRRYPDAYPIHFHTHPDALFSLREGRLVADRSGRICAANRGALEQLRQGKVAALGSVEQLFSMPLDELIERSQRGAFHPVALTPGALPQPFFAVARMPAREAARAAIARGQATPADAAPTAPADSGSAAALSSGPAVTPAALATTSPPLAAGLSPVDCGDPQVAASFKLALRLVQREVPVLLHGETGAGKEVFARALHQAGPRAAAPFVAVNCASLPETLIESELFGYRAGAFTGARGTGRRGLILQAHGGTLLLDEIGDMPLALQARLLRVLDERRITPLGGEESVPVDFQLLSASHRKLIDLVEAGTFREDLYYRLCGLEVLLPPLRERQDRAALITQVLVAEGGSPRQLGAAAADALHAYAWPGNLRQLRRVLQTALALADGGLIEPQHLGPQLATPHPPAAWPAAAAQPGSMAIAVRLPALAGHDDPDLDDPIAAPLSEADLAVALSALTPLQLVERTTLLQRLQAHRWIVSHVARELSISRNSLYRRLHKLHIPLTHAG